MRLILSLAVVTLLAGTAGAVPARQSDLKRPNKEFIYVIADGVFGYRITRNGGLIPVPTGFPYVGQFPNDVVATSNGHFLYVCGIQSSNNNRAGTIYEFRICSNGRLEPIDAADGGSSPTRIVVSPSNRHLYCASYDAVLKTNLLFQYRIKPNGALTPSRQRFIVTGQSAIGDVAEDRTEHFMYLSGTQGISTYRIRANGSLQSVPYAVLRVDNKKFNRNIAVHPTKSYGYVTSALRDSITQFRVVQGRFAPMEPSSTRIGINPTSVVVTYGGSFLYAVCDNGISQYHIRADGTLHPLLRPLLVTSTLRGRLAVTKSGRFAYLTVTGGNDPGSIEQFNIKNGSMSLFKHSFVSTGINPLSLIVVQR